ncbi:hypothetical protein, partial [Klebsiella michiganensis]|uniref:hypothetical protein n=1 Tax=Klebsiella michiganensis TaxID=1134687 RepID=UPI001BD1D3D8
NQRVSAGIGSKGEIFNNSAVEPQPVEPERFWLDFAEVLHVIIALQIGAPARAEVRQLGIDIPVYWYADASDTLTLNAFLSL